MMGVYGNLVIFSKSITAFSQSGDSTLVSFPKQRLRLEILTGLVLISPAIQDSSSWPTCLELPSRRGILAWNPRLSVVTHLPRIA